MALAPNAVRRAARELRNARELVTLVSLSKKLGVSSGRVEYIVNTIAGLREELRIYSKWDFVGLMYVDAADCQRQKGRAVTYVSLARELGRQTTTVLRALERHPDWAVYIGLVSPVDAKRTKRKRAYYAATLELERKKKKKSRYALAQECGYVLHLVLRDFEDDPTLWDLLKN